MKVGTPPLMLDCPHFGAVEKSKRVGYGLMVDSITLRQNMIALAYQCSCFYCSSYAMGDS